MLIYMPVTPLLCCVPSLTKKQCIPRFKRQQ